jgi:hypothetical protein
VDTIENVVVGFWHGVGETVGGAAGAVTVCYVVDVVIAPLAPGVAIPLAQICPAVGGVAGVAATTKANVFGHT